MSELVLMDARVRAWLVREAGETACYIGVRFRNAPQLTVRAAVRPDSAQVVGASTPPETIVTYFAAHAKPQTDASRKLANASRHDKILWWNALPQSSRDGLVTVYRLRGGGLSLSSLAKAATVLFPVAAAANALAATPQGQRAINAIVPGAGTAGAKALAAGSALLKGGNAKTAIGKLIDIGATVAEGNLPDAAKSRAAAGAAAVLRMPGVANTLASHGVPAGSVAKTATALQAASQAVNAKMHAVASPTLARVSDAAATSLLRAANPKISPAAAKKQLQQFIYLQVNE